MPLACLGVITERWRRSASQPNGDAIPGGDRAGRRHEQIPQSAVRVESVSSPHDDRGERQRKGHEPCRDAKEMSGVHLHALR